MLDTLLGDRASEIWTGLGVAVAACIGWFGNRRAERDKQSLPAPPQLSGLVAGLIDSVSMSQLLAEVHANRVANEDTRDIIRDWIKEDTKRRDREEIKDGFDQADRDRAEIKSMIEQILRDSTHARRGRPG